jgi:hypothetical protein
MGIGTMTLRLVVAVGLFFCVITAGFAWYSGRALWLSPSSPKRTTVADAPDRRWVVLEDAVLDCATERVTQRSGLHAAYTLVRASDRSGGRTFVAQLAGADSCEAAAEKPLDGAFIGRFSRMFLAVRQDFALPPGEDVTVFSQFEAPRFLRRALGWRLTWFGLSLLVTVLAMSALWAAEPQPRPLQRRMTKSGRVPARD